MRIKLTWKIFCIIVSILFLMSCSGNGSKKSSTNTDDTDDTDDNNTPASITISGIASKGLISGGTVNIYTITDAGEKGSLLGSTTTASDGTYSYAVTGYTGPVLVEITGGTYVDEATGATLHLGVILRAALPSVSGNVSVAVTPLTEIAVQMAEAGGGFDATKIQNANDLISQLIGADIISTLPANGNDSAIFGSASADAKNYALLLAAISKYSETSGQDVADVIKTLKTDLSDLKLDSTADLLAAITDFLASDKNKTGVSAATALVTIITNIGNNGLQPTGNLAEMKGYFIKFIKDPSEANYTSLMTYMNTFVPASGEAHMFKAMASLMDIYRNSAAGFLKDSGLDLTNLSSDTFDDKAVNDSLLHLAALDTDINALFADLETRLDTVNGDIAQAGGVRTMISLTGFDTVYMDDVDVKILKTFTDAMKSACILVQAVNLHVDTDKWVLGDGTDVRDLILDDEELSDDQMNEFLSKNPNFLKWKDTAKLASFRTAIGKVSDDLTAVVSALDALGSAGRAKRVENAFNLDSDLDFYMAKAVSEKSMPSVISAMGNAGVSVVFPKSEEVSGSIVKKDDGYSYYRHLNDIYLNKYVHNPADADGITLYAMVNGAKTFRDLSVRSLVESDPVNPYIEDVAGRETYMTGVEEIKWDEPIKSFTVPRATITIDGNASDWDNVPVLCSSGGNHSATIKLAAGEGNVYYAYVSFPNGPDSRTAEFFGGISTYWPWPTTPTLGYHGFNANFYNSAPPPGSPSPSGFNASENGWGGPPGGETDLPVSGADIAMTEREDGGGTGFEIKFSRLDWLTAENFINNIYFQLTYMIFDPLTGMVIPYNEYIDKEIKFYRP
jgi:hypothetical protein